MNFLENPPKYLEIINPKGWGCLLSLVFLFCQGGIPMYQPTYTQRLWALILLLDLGFPASSYIQISLLCGHNLAAYPTVCFSFISM